MTRDESRTLAITAGVLFLAGAARAGLEAVRSPLALEADTVSADALAADSRDMVDERERRSAPLAPGERLDPNTAGEEELDRLPGIGPAAARAIVESRIAEGPFGDVGALTRVRGIGPATVERLAPHLTLEAGGGGRRARGALAATPQSARNPASSGNQQVAPAIDLNRATPEELEQVRGIGPALAARIIAHRDEVGGFGRVEDLIEVRGIGPATLQSMRGRFFVRQ
ncbi:MAG: helix-hairpin-helix domain-containing protein [Gammaproteobacteria bacterium]|nr:helix-hairpin-helix domain-containing protein [Gammaproteobacteria bacterium]